MAIFRAGLWSKFNTPQGGHSLKSITRLLVSMRLDKTRRYDHKGLTSAIRNGTWSATATPHPQHRESLVCSGVTTLDAKVRVARVGPGRYALHFA